MSFFELSTAVVGSKFTQYSIDVGQTGLVSPGAENIIYKSKLIMELSFILICPTAFIISYLNSYIMEQSET